jgi:hypothetical protein
MKRSDTKSYFDEAFLHVLGFDAFRRQLEDFWPKGGSHWDALAKVDTAGNAGAILVEAKAHPTDLRQEGSWCFARVAQNHRGIATAN